MDTSHDAVKKPIVLNSTNFPRHAVEMITDTEEAERLQAAASKLGGFIVVIIAREGDTFKIINTDNSDRVVTSATEQLDKGKVIVRMRNTTNPQTPTNLSPLWRELEANQ